MRLQQLFAALAAKLPAVIPAADVAVVVAHPDDEAIGIGGHLARLDDVLIVHLTNGSPADIAAARSHGFPTQAAYAEARRAEFERAMADGGVARFNEARFDIDDQALALQLVAAAERLAALFAERGTAVALTHPYEGGHPDHDAAAFLVRAAAHLARGRGRPVEVGEMAFYHAGDRGMVSQQFSAIPPVPEIVIQLDDAAWHRKERMLAAFATQRGALGAFKARSERFRVAPVYDFTHQPNGGRLHFETFCDWRGPRWQRLARGALAELSAAAS